VTGPRSTWDATWEAELAEPPGLDAHTLENHIDQRKIEFLHDLLPREGRAIEIGCGSARLLARVRRAAGVRAFALDPSPHALQLAARTAAAFEAPMTRLSGDAVQLPFPDGAFDLVLSGGLLEHFEEPRTVVSEMVRVLRPGGVFYADVVPRKLSLYRARELPRMLRHADLMEGVHESAFGPRHYCTILSGLGCRDIRVRAAGVYPPGSGPGWARRTAALDGTKVADWLGWYFMIAARRAA
jgi:SAM-dependent methyltransferase